MIKIYHNQQVIIIHHADYQNCERCQAITGKLDHEHIFNFFESEEACLCFSVKRPEKLLEQLKGFFKTVFAAGGLVVNNKEEVLLMYRHGRWDLPKGIIDEGEDSASAAIREVMEECGIPAPEILGFLKDTYHIYKHHNGQWVLKQTRWYAMLGHAEGPATPQLSEGITEVSWVNASVLEHTLKESYYNIRNLIRETNLDYWMQKIRTGH